MKNAMKRIMSILLVALLLVSALPLAASATPLGGGSGNTSALGNSEGNPSALGNGNSSETSNALGSGTDSQNQSNETQTTGSLTNGNRSAFRSASRDDLGERGGYDVSQGEDEAFYQVAFYCDADSEYVPESATATWYKVSYTAKAGNLVSEFLEEGKYSVINVEGIQGETESRTTISGVAEALLHTKNSGGYDKYYIHVAENKHIEMRVYLEGDFWKRDTFYGEYTGLSMLNKIVPNWRDTYVQTYGGTGSITSKINLEDSYKATDTNLVLSVYLTADKSLGESSSNNNNNNDNDNNNPSVAGQVRIIVYQNNDKIRDQNFDIYPGGATVYEALTEGYGLNAGLFSRCYVNGVYSIEGVDTIFHAGDEVEIYLSKGNGNDNLTINEHLLMPVYLWVYTNNTIGGDPDLKIDITNSIAADGLVDMNDVANVVKNYYKSIDTAKGIVYDGLYIGNTGWSAEFVAGNRLPEVDNIKARRAQSQVIINVMLYNASRKTTNSVADTSNPKTGDTIFAPVAILGASATALAAAMFFYNKKRMAR